METKSITVFKDTGDEEIAVMLRPLNGHPKVHGLKLAEYLVSYAEAHEAAIDMTDLAAGVVGEFKRRVRKIYLVAPHTEHEDVSYVYVLKERDGKLMIEVRDNEKKKVMFNGNAHEMIRWAEALATDSAALAPEFISAIEKLAPSPTASERLCMLLNNLRLKGHLMSIPGHRRTGRELGLLVAIGSKDEIHARIEEAIRELERADGKRLRTVVFLSRDWLSDAEWKSYEGSFSSVNKLFLISGHGGPRDLRQKEVSVPSTKTE